MRLLIATALVIAQAGSPIFRFETDGFWLNLHHYLYVLGRAQNGAPDIKRRAVENAPADQAEGLKSASEAERQAWGDAVTFYAAGLSKQDAVFTRPLIAATNALRVAPDTPSTALKVDASLRDTLERAAPVYRRIWWPSHQESNHERAREYSELLAQHGSRVLGYITRAYQATWPSGGFVINLSGYSNWAGAYSTDGDLIVISSLDRDSRGSLGLESMFHEAMHQWDQPMLARLSRLSKAHQTAPPREGITHALIWYTAAAAVKSVFPGHVGYAERGGMWKQKVLGGFKPGLDTHWQPYLAGKGTLDEALLALLKS
ncbi:MAG TPA: hypothetical protein VEA16_10700 [Vicinamibacterales bacterium]|nr:hypothetical protein [Vicinamibacterales bacterium]